MNAQPDTPLLEGLRPVGPGETTPDQHRTMLRNVFNFYRMSNQGAAPGITVTQVKKCRELVDKRVPVSLNGPMSIFLEFNDWYSSEQIRGLFEAYVQAGYLELNNAPPGVALPLEASITRNHFDFFRAAMDCGADERLVPSVHNRVRLKSDWDEENGDDTEYELQDIHDLIANDVTSLEIASAMRAVLWETSMNRRIRESTVVAAAGAEPSSRHRRIVL